MGPDRMDTTVAHMDQDQAVDHMDQALIVAPMDQDQIVAHMDQAPIPASWLEYWVEDPKQKKKIL